MKHVWEMQWRSDTSAGSLLFATAEGAVDYIIDRWELAPPDELRSKIINTLKQDGGINHSSGVNRFAYGKSADGPFLCLGVQRRELLP